MFKMYLVYIALYCHSQQAQRRQTFFLWRHYLDIIPKGGVWGGRAFQASEIGRDTFKDTFEYHIDNENKLK